MPASEPQLEPILPVEAYTSRARYVSEWFGAVEPDLGPHRVDELVERKQLRTEQIIEANWKIVVENFIDGYHLKHLHSGTLAMYDHDRIESRWHGPHFTFREPLSADYAKDPARQSSLPLIDDIPRERLGAWVPMLFPGIGLAETESTWSVFHVTPLAPERTRVVTRTKVADASSWEFAAQMLTSGWLWSRSRGKFEGDPGEDPLASGDFLAEDKYACEQQQKSLRSPYFRPGPSAVQGEAPVRRHQQIVQEWLT